MNTTLIISITLGIAAFALFNTIFDVQFFSGVGVFFLDLIDTFAEYLGKYNTKRYV
jgi:hypothetical protein